VTIIKSVGFLLGPLSPLSQSVPDIIDCHCATLMHDRVFVLQQVLNDRLVIDHFTHCDKALMLYDAGLFFVLTRVQQVRHRHCKYIVHLRKHKGHLVLEQR
jgi:hypothetical protein